MKVLIAALTYGSRQMDVINDNIARCGYENKVLTFISVHGIAQALNAAFDAMLIHNCDAVALLANDIVEPDNWLQKKVAALSTYPKAGVVASTLHDVETTIRSQHIISNWLIARSTFETIGYFNEQYTPYGPIDLDYCDRCRVADIGTYYVIDCHAKHIGEHATGNEYGYDKAKLVADSWGLYNRNLQGYNDGTISIKIKRNG
jgi:GT2 family glycosyltransferase